MGRSDVTPLRGYLDVGGMTRGQQLENIDERARRIRRQEVRRLTKLWGHSLSAAVSSASAYIQRRRREQVTRRELSALDDHLLRDIGLSRSEIPYMARVVAAADRNVLLERPVTALQLERSPSLQVVVPEASARPKAA